MIAVIMINDRQYAAIKIVGSKNFLPKNNSKIPAEIKMIPKIIEFS